MTAGGADYEMFREVPDEFDDEFDDDKEEMAVAPPRILTVECPRCTFRFQWHADAEASPGTYRNVVQASRDLLKDVWAAFCSGNTEMWMHAMNKLAAELTEHGPWSPRSPDRIMERYEKVCEDRDKHYAEKEQTREELLKALDRGALEKKAANRLRFWLWVTASLTIALAIMLAVAVSS